MSTLFVGLGMMGAPMVRHLAGTTDLLLFDLSPAAQTLAGELGATALPALSAIPDHVESVILMLPNSRIIESVLLDDGVLERLAPGSIVIDMSSSLPASTRELANRASALGVDFVDAPVSGGVAKARTGELAIMAGGEARAVERAGTIVAPMSAAFIHVGPSGAGHAAKALNNLLSATNLAAIAEVLVVGARFGIDPAVLVDVINASTGRSQASEVKYPQQVLTGAYASGFALDLMVKDLRIALTLADDLGVDSPVTRAATASTESALHDLGGVGLDHTQIAEWYEKAHDVLLRPHERNSS
ncbi:NAD(P)-dependent oxidoreductase [uncultured Microbacterium sp.]|uniref:NAD(P)-dependent oxidoreductase n=1 Tax=uncultured Microbacterium sp. TaxID=191216 RepID=UPI0028D2AC92|nr:NAD(P)-dependent oxidoreductase [uncultured Microbacterium sp.]